MFDYIIYDEEIESYENEIALERALINSNLSIDLMYFENTSNIDDDTKLEKFKAMIQKIIEAFKTFMIKCKDYLKSAINKLLGRVQGVYTEYTLDQVLNDFDSKIEKAQSKGMKSFKFIDVHALYKCLQDESNEYTKIIKTFTKSYIKNGSPKDAEKVIKQYEDLSSNYNTKLKNILEMKKEYSIREARMVANVVKLNNKLRSGNFVDIIDKYKNTCQEIESLTIASLNSLNKYSEDTGYVQNAKSLQDIIHNSCIRLQTHSAECITAIISYGVPVLCSIDKLAHLRKDEDGKIIDISSDDRKSTRKVIENLSSVGTNMANAKLSSIRKTSRKEDIKDWKFTKGESPFTFDR